MRNPDDKYPVLSVGISIVVPLVVALGFFLGIRILGSSLVDFVIWPIIEKLIR